MESTMNSAPLLASPETAVRALHNGQATDIAMYHVSGGTGITDYHVLCTGRSGTHVRALADRVEYQYAQLGVEAARVEGHEAGAWVLLDYSTVIVHVFDAQSREYYKLERLLNPEDKVDISAWTVDESAEIENA